jgi:predicted RecB family nuclease
VAYQQRCDICLFQIIPYFAPLEINPISFVLFGSGDRVYAGKRFSVLFLCYYYPIVGQSPHPNFMLITDKILFNYQRCQRKSYLNLHGNPSEQSPLSDLMEKIHQDSYAYRQTILDQLAYQEPLYRPGDWSTGAQATLELMKQGVDCIANGVLLVDAHPFPQVSALSSVAESSDFSGQEMPIWLLGDLDGVTLLSFPSLLVKKTGVSQLGDWYYQPIDIKFSKRPKRDYQMMGAFHAQLLAAIQGFLPDSGLILRDKGHYFVDVTKWLNLMQQTFFDCLQMLQNRTEPEVFISRHPCETCQWYDSCYAIASATRHLSLLPGVTATRYHALKQLNITTWEALAAANPVDLIPYFEATCQSHPVEQVTQAIVLQAQACLQNLAIALPTAEKLSNSLGLEQLPVAPIELYFDIEAQPELNLSFLHGVLKVDRTQTTPDNQPLETFHYFLAKTPEDEGLMWEKFLQFVWEYPTAPIFHFCPYEAQEIKNLAKRYRTPASRWRPIIPRLIDVHALVTHNVVMPVESYSLKAIARSLGFQWRDPAASGAQCIVWYDQWLKTNAEITDNSSLDNPSNQSSHESKNEYLASILTYNEDDCRATYIVKTWLVNFLI